MSTWSQRVYSWFGLSTIYQIYFDASIFRIGDRNSTPEQIMYINTVVRECNYNSLFINVGDL